jgi:hypothetical protein
MNKAFTIRERVAQGLVAAMALGFLVSGIFYLYQGRTVVTHGDYWYLYDLCLNRPWLTCALMKYAGHSFFFPNLIWLINIYFFHNNQQLLFVIGIVLLFLTVALPLVLVWRDNTVGRTAKLEATLVLIVGNFWMARCAITASGGFNTICSLALASAWLAFFYLPHTRGKIPQSRMTWLFVLAGGFVSSFSFGAGLGVWPTLLALGWGLRLSWRSLGILFVAAICAALIYTFLPGNVYSGGSWQPAISWLISVGTAIQLICRLLGAPLLDATTAWGSQNFSSEIAASSMLSLWGGAVGLVLGAIAVVPRFVRRDLGRSNLQFVGVSLVIFNFLALALVVAGRAVQSDLHLGGFSAPRYLVTAPRYLYWSSLFWTGLVLVAIERAELKRWWRWATFLVVLALPALVFPDHLRWAVFTKRASLWGQSAATGVIIGVRDPDKFKVLAIDPERIFKLAPQFRARRLDMFAPGLQDWIGQSENSLFGGRQRSLHLQGAFRVEALVATDDGAPAARASGRVVCDGNEMPDQLVIVDPAGKICGLARPTLYQGPVKLRQKLFGFGPNAFVGYIRDYDPAVQYDVRVVTHHELSEEKLRLRLAPTPGHKQP